ncbi:hypothetical protein LTR84_007089 [Exophiala bonariae]|uniref:Uncharacterized protein n=1 Tax=Exophiala bonariae TaxID=1690606 RepID=A0AAV9MZV1_9EURO|nr:hypothetical protein LTR84_007089 [Exophiala bonariae]
MALRSAWWMSSNPNGPLTIPATQSNIPVQNQPPHKRWPGSKSSGFTFNELEKFIAENSHHRCWIQKYTYTPGDPSSQQSSWKQTGEVWSVPDLLALLQIPDADNLKSSFFFLRDASGEAVQALGHYLDLTPRFFNFQFVMLSTGNTVDSYAFFGLQIIEKYLPTGVPAKVRAQAAPYATFGNYEWHTTMIAALFMRVGDRFRGVLHFQANDEAIADGMKQLMTREEERTSSEGEDRAGQGQILAEIMYIVRYQWEFFLNEADVHLQGLSKQCIEGELTSNQQLKAMRDLHPLLPMWAFARRRINAAKDLNTGMCSHPYFVTNQLHEAFRHYLAKCNLVLDECYSRCDALTVQTENIINLIFNIATLQDTKASVEQSMAANASAASIRRVTLLTFIYLPLMLVASIYGMNIREISHGAGEPPIWSYFVASLLVLVGTLSAWMLWSRFAGR